MLSKHAKLWLGLIAIVSLMSLASSCGSKVEDDETKDGGTEAGKAYTAKGKEGNISGVISYTGTAPEPKKIDTAADAACTSKNPNLMTEEWAVKDGKVANTYVYIKEGTLTDGSKVSAYSTWPGTPAAAVL